MPPGIARKIAIGLQGRNGKANVCLVIIDGVAHIGGFCLTVNCCDKDIRIPHAWMAIGCKIQGLTICMKKGGFLILSCVDPWA